jgi:uncharacterized membrane protein
VGEVMVVLALPIFLFSTDWTLFRAQARPIFAGMLLAVVSAIAVVSTVFATASGTFSREAGALMLGVYTGGTPNMAAVKVALHLPDTLFLTLTAFDSAFTTVYLLLIMAAGRWIAGSAAEEIPQKASSTKDMFRVMPFLTPLAASVLLLGVSAGIGSFVPETMRGALIISLVSVAGMVLSHIKILNNPAINETTGLALLLVFCTSIGMQVSSEAFRSENLQLGIWVGVILFGSVLVHAVLCRVFRLPGSIFLMTNVAAICSPPFVPAVAENAGLSRLIPAGIAAGVFGYAVGTFLGMAWFALAG